MKKITLFITLLSPLCVYSATVTDVGLLSAPTGYTAASSLCVDINESGHAACLSKAFGVPYKCGYRLSKTCQKVSNTVFRYVNPQTKAVVASGIDSGSGSPTNTISGINEWGDVAWGNTTFISNVGKIIETKTIVGGSKTVFNSKAYTLNNTLIPFAGVPTTSNDTITSPNAISNSGELAGMQWATVISTLEGIKGIGGTGLFVNQATLDHLISIGDDATQTWADGAVSFGWNSRRSYAYDINDAGIVVVGLSGYSPSPLGTKICNRDLSCISDIEVDDMGVIAVNRPVGINNVGDAVGYFYPNNYSLTNYPVAWINGINGDRERIDLNAAIANTGYVLVSVGDINDSQQIAGTCLKNGLQRGCLIDLTP